jgi:hypothetical protein
MKFILQGPEGFPDRPGSYETLDELAQAAAKFLLRFLHQGYYTDSNMKRQPLDWVAANLSVSIDAEDDGDLTASGDDEDWRKLGVVGVDSGQLMICDPCYINSQWRGSDAEARTYSPVFKHEDGRMFHCVLHGEGRPGSTGFGNFEEVLQPYGETVNNLIEQGKLAKIVDGSAFGEFSYAGCCATTMNSEDQGGQLLYTLGHEGAGVVSSSGFGDGVYPVYARYLEDPEWGRRVAELKVVMISSEEQLEEEEDGE